jgi:hypothetical protein
LDDDVYALPTSTTPAHDTTTSCIASDEVIEQVDSPEIQRSHNHAHSPFLPPDSNAKKKHSNVDVDDGQPSTRNTKRVKRADSNVSLRDFLLEEREKREEFQGLMLLQMEKGNSQFERSLETTQSFQNNFLAILARAFNKGA